MASAVARQVQPAQVILQKEGIQEAAKEAKLEVMCTANVKGDAIRPLSSMKDDSMHYHWFSNQGSIMPSQPQSPPKYGEPSPSTLHNSKVDNEILVK